MYLYNSLISEYSYIIHCTYVDISEDYQAVSLNSFEQLLNIDHQLSSAPSQSDNIYTYDAFTHCSFC